MNCKTLKGIVLLCLIISGFTACTNSDKQIEEQSTSSVSTTVDSAALREQALDDTANFSYIRKFLNEVIYNRGISEKSFATYFDGRDEIDSVLKHYMDSGVLKPYDFKPGKKDVSMALDYMSWRMQSTCLSINRDWDSIYRMNSADDIDAYKLEFKCGEVFYFVLNQDKQDKHILAILDRAKLGLVPLDYGKKWRLNDWK